MSESSKADSIAFHFYTKLFFVVNAARSTAEPRVQAKIDKWFNLETPDSDLFTKEAREQYKALISSTGRPPPPLEIQVLLTLPANNQNRVLVHQATPASSRVRIEPAPSAILLERWTMAYSSATPHTEEPITLPTIYKHGMSLFRSLYTLLRIMPAWKLRRRNMRDFAIDIRVGQVGSNVLAFDSNPVVPLEHQSHTFPPVSLTMGTLSLSTTYLSSPQQFQLAELESLLSSRFLSLDDEENRGFVPTLSKRTLGSSPGSLPIRTSLPKSPPTNSSVLADRFMTQQTNSPKSTSLSSSPRIAAPVPSSGLSYTRPLSDSLEGSHTSSTGSSSLSRPSARIRKESSSSNDLPSAPGLPMRRPSLNQPLHGVFKSSTLSSSSSLRQASPLAVMPPSPLGATGRVPVSPSRPSSVLPGEAVSGSLPKKRYSSSFGHRYQTSADSTAGRNGTSYIGPTPTTTTTQTTTTDDDDISSFVQSIDARKPLSHSIIQPEQPFPVLHRSASAENVHEPMLTTAPEVEARLKTLNAEFLASLVGLGSRGNARRSNTASSGGSTVKGSTATVRGRGVSLVGSTASTSTSTSASGQGRGIGGSSEEVIGRMDF